MTQPIDILQARELTPARRRRLVLLVLTEAYQLFFEPPPGFPSEESPIEASYEKSEIHVGSSDRRTDV